MHVLWCTDDKAVVEPLQCSSVGLLSPIKKRGSVSEQKRQGGSRCVQAVAMRLKGGVEALAFDVNRTCLRLRIALDTVPSRLARARACAIRPAPPIDARQSRVDGDGLATRILLFAAL